MSGRATRPWPRPRWPGPGTPPTRSGSWPSWGGCSRPQGVLAARYLADGQGEPDDRGIQLDGVGWTLWATAQVARGLAGRGPRGLRAAAPRGCWTGRRLRPSGAVDNPRTLPPVSADYWEVRERRPTLSTAALLAAGLDSAADLYAVLGDEASRAATADTAARLRSVILARFGPTGFPRHLGGRADSVDLGVCFLLPPFSAAAEPAVVTAWRQARHGDGPAGGRAGPRRIVAAGRDQLDERDGDVRPRPPPPSASERTRWPGWRGSTGTGRRPARSRRRCSPTAVRPRSPRWPGRPPP